jgi:hypothetical protein
MASVVMPTSALTPREQGLCNHRLALKSMSSIYNNYKMLTVIMLPCKIYFSDCLLFYEKVSA